MNFFLETGKNRFFHFFPVPGFPGTGDFLEKIPVLEKNEKKKKCIRTNGDGKKRVLKKISSAGIFLKISALEKSKNLGTGKKMDAHFWVIFWFFFRCQHRGILKTSKNGHFLIKSAYSCMQFSIFGTTFCRSVGR